MSYKAYDDGNLRIVLKCPCTCWYCLSTASGHCGKGKCDRPQYHPEDHTIEENLALEAERERNRLGRESLHHVQEWLKVENQP